MTRKVSALCLFLSFCAIVFITGCAQNSPDAIYNRGLQALEEKDPIAAALYFDDFIQKFPEDERIVDAYWSLVYSYNMMNDHSSAREVLQTMTEKFTDPLNKTNAEFAIAKTYFDQGAFDQAIQAFDEIASATDEAMIQVEANRWIANAYAQQTQAATAVEYYDKAAQIAKSKVEEPTRALDLQIQMLASKANVYRASKEFEKARGVYKTSLDVLNSATQVKGLDPVKEDAVIQWANTFVWAGDYVTAATTYDQIQDNPYIREQTKPYLIEWKIRSLKEKFARDDTKEFTPEEKAILVTEYQRITEGYPKTDMGVDANIQIARLVQDATPAMSETYLNNAITAYDKMIAEPTSPEKPLLAMLKKADAYIKLDKFEDAKQTLKTIQQRYSEVPQATGQAEQMLEYIRRVEEQRMKAQQETEQPQTEEPQPEPEQ